MVKKSSWKSYATVRKRRLPKRIQDIDKGFQKGKIDLDAEINVNEEQIKQYTFQKEKVSLKEQQVYIMKHLIERWGDNIDQMVYDKWNLLQYTKEQLQLYYEKYQKLNTYEDVDLNERFMGSVKKLANKKDEEKKPQTAQMDVAHAQRIQHLQKLMQRK